MRCGRVISKRRPDVGFRERSDLVDGVQRQSGFDQFLAAGKVSPQGLVFKAMIIKVERAAVFADRARSGVVEALCALAFDFNSDFHVVTIRFQPLDDFVSNLSELLHGTLGLRSVLCRNSAFWALVGLARRLIHRMRDHCAALRSAVKRLHYWLGRFLGIQLCLRNLGLHDQGVVVK